MLDFTSALYLGFEHPSWSLKPWSRLTNGKPAALVTNPATRQLETRIAALQGTQAAAVGASTLHLFHDLFSILSQQRVSVYRDEGAYPISAWGARALNFTSCATRFSHYDPDALESCLRKYRGDRRRPVVITDGYCPACGRHAPLPAYEALISRYGGLLVVDDTQSLGIFGSGSQSAAPYGLGGGGSLRWHQMSDDNVIFISSMAKAFGTSLAVLSANNEIIRDFKLRSDSRVHCSPPSMADMRAARQALVLNRKRGTALRTRLAQRILRFRMQLAYTGISVVEGMFPVQLLSIPGIDVVELHAALLRRGVMTLVQRGCGHSDFLLTFIITSRHSSGDIDRASQILCHSLEAGSQPPAVA